MNMTEFITLLANAVCKHHPDSSQKEIPVPNIGQGFFENK